MTRGHELVEGWAHSVGVGKAAEAAGISRFSVHAYIRGDRSPSRSVALRIERASGGQVPVGSWDEPAVWQ